MTTFWDDFSKKTVDKDPHSSRPPREAQPPRSDRCWRILRYLKEIHTILDIRIYSHSKITVQSSFLWYEPVNSWKRQIDKWSPIETITGQVGHRA